MDQGPLTSSQISLKRWDFLPENVKINIKSHEIFTQNRELSGINLRPGLSGQGLFKDKECLEDLNETGCLGRLYDATHRSGCRWGLIILTAQMCLLTVWCTDAAARWKFSAHGDVQMERRGDEMVVSSFFNSHINVISTEHLMRAELFLSLNYF